MTETKKSYNEDEMVHQLFEIVKTKFEETGVMNEIRCILQNKIITMMNKSNPTSPLINVDKYNAEISDEAEVEANNSFNIVNLLIMEYLHWHGYKYSADIFSKETGVQNVLPSRDFLENCMGKCEEQTIPVLLYIITGIIDQKAGRKHKKNKIINNERDNNCDDEVVPKLEYKYNEQQQQIQQQQQQQQQQRQQRTKSTQAIVPSQNVRLNNVEYFDTNDVMNVSDTNGTSVGTIIEAAAYSDDSETNGSDKYVQTCNTPIVPHKCKYNNKDGCLVNFMNKISECTTPQNEYIDAFNNKYYKRMCKECKLKFHKQFNVMVNNVFKNEFKDEYQDVHCEQYKDVLGIDYEILLNDIIESGDLIEQQETVEVKTTQDDMEYNQDEYEVEEVVEDEADDEEEEEEE